MGGIKNVDLRNKTISMQCSWVKRLFEDDFHDWKIVPLFLIDKHLGKNFKFHNNLDISNDILSKRQTVSLYIFLFFPGKNVIGQLFNDSGNIKPWKDLKQNFILKIHKIYWLQIIDALPKTWKDIILKDKRNAKSLVIFDHHIVRNSQIHSLNKPTSKELYLILVEANTVKPTAQDYFKNLFETSQFNWKIFFF